MWKDDTERYGAYVISKVLSVNVIERDIPGAQPGTVDGEIQYSDGRTAAVEFTSVHPQERFHLSKKLAPRKVVPAPGRLTWGIHPATAEDFDRLLRVHERIIRIAEDYGTGQLEALPFDVVADDPDLRWLLWESRSRMTGFPAEHSPVIFWLNPTIASFVGDAQTEILDGVQAAMNVEHVAAHLLKLLRDDHDERHLFLGIGMGGLSAAASLVLMNGPELPSEDPAVPVGIDHLWLGPGFGKTVTVWSRGRGWRNEWLSDTKTGNG